MLVEHGLALPAEDIATWMVSTPDWRLLAKITVTYRWVDAPGAAFTTRATYALREVRADTLTSEYLEEQAATESGS